jgi:hypothetical protein
VPRRIFFALSRWGRKRPQTPGSFVALAFGLALGCDARPVHTFVGYPYDAERDCLGDRAILDVIDGKDPGECAEVRCWLGPDGAVVMTDTACDAPVSHADHTQDASGDCPKALEAYGRGDDGRCPGDGGG